jgi:hypothetical protein
MKRGSIRTVKKYVEVDGERKIKYAIQGRKNGIWIPIVEKSKTKNTVLLEYDTKKEAEDKLKEIIGKIKGRPYSINPERR